MVTAKRQNKKSIYILSKLGVFLGTIEITGLEVGSLKRATFAKI